MKRTTFILTGVLMMALLVAGTQIATTIYTDQRQEEEIQKYCNSINTSGDLTKVECWQQYIEENTDEDRNTKVLDVISMIYDFCDDERMYEACRVLLENMNEIYGRIRQPGGQYWELVWLECQSGEPEEWTQTHCPYGLTNGNTICKQSGASSITMSCTTPWVLIT